MKDKYIKEELYKKDAVTIYKMVLKGDIITRFPIGFWRKSQSKENAAKCLRFLIEEILKYNEEELKSNYSKHIFLNNKLSGALKYCFNDSPYKAINYIYCGKFKEWEFKNVPLNFWDDEINRIYAIKWLIKDKLLLNDDNELLNNLSTQSFIDNGLNGLLKNYFNGSVYEAVNAVYPNRFKKNDFKNYK